MAAKDTFVTERLQATQKQLWKENPNQMCSNIVQNRKLLLTGAEIKERPNNVELLKRNQNQKCFNIVQDLKIEGDYE